MLLRRVIRNGAINALCNVALLGLMVCSYRLWLTNHGPVATDGWLILTAITGFGSLCDLGLSGVIIQQMASRDPERRAGWMRSCSRFLGWSSMLGMLGSGLGAWWWMGTGLAHVPAAAAVAAWTVGLVWTNYQMGILKADLRFGKAAMVALMQQASVFLLPAIVPVDAGYLVPTTVAAIGTLGAAAYGAAAIAAYARADSQPIPATRLLLAGLPYASHSWLAYFFSHFQRLILVGCGQPGDIAALSASQSVFGKVQGVIGAAGESLNPEVASGGMDPRWLWRALLVNTVVCVSGFSLVTVLAYLLFRIWLPGDIGERALGIMPILAAGYALSSSTSVAFHILNGMGRPWGNPICGALAAVASIVILMLGKGSGWSPLAVSAFAISAAFLVYAVLILVYAFFVLRDHGQARPHADAGSGDHG